MSPVESLKTKNKFKKTEIGDIPVDWNIVELKNFIVITPGFPFSSKYFNQDQIGLPLVRIRDLVQSSLETYYLGKYDKNYVVSDGDVLIGMDGEFYVVIWHGPEALLNQRICKVESNAEDLAQKYLFYQLIPAIKKIENSTPATTVKHLSTKDINKIKIVLPPHSEQIKIAEILSAVDVAIEKIDVVVEKTKQLKKGLMRQLLTHGIGHTKFKKTEIGKIPADWRIKKLQEVATIKRGKFQHRPRNEPRFYGGKYPFVQTGDVTTSNGRITSYTQTLNDEGLAISRLFSKGTILITIAANIGETAIAEFDVAFPDSLIGIAVEEEIDNRFLEYYLRTRKNYFNSVATQSAQKNINLETLKPHPVPVPPKEEQIKIADILTTAGEEIKKETLQKKNLENLKKSLMDILLTGKVRVKTE